MQILTSRVSLLANLFTTSALSDFGGIFSIMLQEHFTNFSMPLKTLTLELQCRVMFG
jgi:hypothetical protein